MAVYEFKISPQYDNREALVTIIKGRAVNLTGKELKSVKETREDGPVERIIAGATQEDLAEYWEMQGGEKAQRKGGANILVLRLQKSDAKTDKQSKKSKNTSTKEKPSGAND